MYTAFLVVVVVVVVIVVILRNKQLYIRFFLLNSRFIILYKKYLY
jgi:hypothetical protein